MAAYARDRHRGGETNARQGIVVLRVDRSVGSVGPWGGQQVKEYAMRDSNPQPPDSKSDTLSIAPTAPPKRNKPHKQTPAVNHTLKRNITPRTPHTTFTTKPRLSPGHLRHLNSLYSHTSRRTPQGGNILFIEPQPTSHGHTRVGGHEEAHGRSMRRGTCHSACAISPRRRFSSRGVAYRI